MFSWIREVDLFIGCESGFLDAIMLALRPRVYLKDEYIFEIHSKAEGMMFLLHGVVAIVSAEEDLICCLKEGAYFGEVALFTEKARRTASVISAVPCSCYFLHRNDFEAACEDYADDADRMQVLLF